MENLYKNRRDAFLHQSMTQGAGNVVITDPLNIRYLTGVQYAPHERFLALLLDGARGRFSLVLPAMEIGRLPDSSIAELGYLDGEDASLLLTDHFAPGAGLALEKDNLRLLWAERILRQSGYALEQVRDASPWLQKMRLYKDPTELACLEKAGKLSDALLAVWSSQIQLDQSEKALGFSFMHLVAEQTDCEAGPGTQISTGVNTSVSHGIRNERLLCQGDPVLIDFGLRCQGYYSDMTRTFFAGPPEPRFREIYSIVEEAQAKAIESVQPGRSLSEVDLAARRVIEKAGYGDYFNHRTGHGLGLDIHESPDVRQDNRQIMEPNMVFTIEPGIYLPGVGGVRIEDDVIVTDHGCQLLTHAPKCLSDMILPIGLCSSHIEEDRSENQILICQSIGIY